MTSFPRNLFPFLKFSKVNVGLFAGAARAFYLQPDIRRNSTIVSSTIAATIGLLTAEGYVAEQYIKTPRGQAEQRRVKQEGTLIYKHLHEQIFRPGVLGGLVGLGMSFLLSCFLIQLTSLLRSQCWHLGCCRILFLHQLGQAYLG